MKKKYLSMITFSLINAFSQPLFASPPVNLTQAKFAVVDYYESGHFNKDVQLAVKEGDLYLSKRIDENNQLPHPQRLAIVLDIDDTSLSNFPNYKQTDFAHLHNIIVNGFHNTTAPAIKPILELYNKALRNGVYAFFISGRPDDVKLDTITNLHRAGYFGWTEMYLINKSDTKQPAEIYKTSIRKKLTLEGYQIILNIGDQESDFLGGYTERNLKVPNPLYSLTEELKRADSRQ